MAWRVVYFESPRGERFVKKFIDGLAPVVKAKYIGMIDFLEEYGPFLSGKYTKKLRKDLYELRITGKEQIRVLYTVRERNIILLHAFKKKTQRTPLKEIKTALLRLDKL
ncbi:MAG TPA: type II toxin-antitoxin system RelE/ParE family toxin [Patescibacteria group bacterium]|nr:type II toxin-antitoxin system RelE/ParE family toxin [Patescibacteria group bacterium]